MKNISVYTALLIGSALCCAQIPAQGPGRITGIVLNENWQPVAHANVCISTTRSNSTFSRCDGVTDQSGQFEIQHVAMGTFLVSAIQEEDGYDRAADPQNKVILTLQEPTANVTIKLGPRAGMLMGSVRDSVTGKLVENIRVLYMAATDERGGGGSTAGYTGGKFRLNLATATDFVVFVAAPGYKPWVYNDPADGLSLRLASGEQKSVEIELVPDPRATKDANGTPASHHAE